MAEDSGFAMGYALGQDGGSNSKGNGGFGDLGGIWGILALLLILGGIGGFGGRGGGGLFGGGSGGGGDSMSAGFAWQGLDNGIRGIQQGLADGFYAMNTGLLNGFHGVDNAICNLGYQMKDCCCQTQRAIDGVNYNMASHFCALGNTIQSSTRDIIENQNANYRGLMDFMVQSKIDKLQSENQELRFAASQASQNAFITANQEAQTAELIRRLGKDNPVPAYIVQPSTPLNFPTNGCGTVQFGGWGGRDCGCGCGY